MTRILITGSRRWDRADLLRQALVSVWTQQGCPPDLELVHGGATGADQIAGEIWAQQLGLPVRVVPADWQRACDDRCTHAPRSRGQRCPAAGPLRNQEMVDLGGYVQAIAAVLPESRGTHDCMRRIRLAGIPLLTITP